jgi:hypothetical protein
MFVDIELGVFDGMLWQIFLVGCDYIAVSVSTI